MACIYKWERPPNRQYSPYSERAASPARKTLTPKRSPGKLDPELTRVTPKSRLPLAEAGKVNKGDFLSFSLFPTGVDEVGFGELAKTLDIDQAEALSSGSSLALLNSAHYRRSLTDPEHLIRLCIAVLGCLQEAAAATAARTGCCRAG